MSSAVLALFERSLRVETRSWLMCFARMALPAAILLWLFPMVATVGGGRYSAPGREVFQGIAWMNFIFITVAGLSYFASAITEEKEELTLGLLRMTDLNPVSILLGKSTARLVGAMVLLAVQLPFTLLAVTLGGVSNLQVLATYGVLLGYLFFLSNLALVWSVVFRQTSTAAAVTGLCLGFHMALPFVLPLCLEAYGDWLGFGVEYGLSGVALRGCRLLASLQPFTGLNLVFTTGAALRPVLTLMLGNLVLGMLCFLLAWALFDPCTREEKDPESGGMRALMRRKGCSVRVPARVSGARAISWKDSRFSVGGPVGMVLKGMVLLPVYALIASLPAITGSRTDLTRAYVGGSLMITTLVMAGLFAAADAARVFAVEVREKTLSTLLLLPVSVREVAYRKVAGHLYGWIPFAVFFTAGAVLYPEGIIDALKAVLGSGSESTPALVALMSVMTVVFFLHLTAYLSLVVKRGALGLALIIQYVGSTIVMMPFALLIGSSSSAGPETVMVLVFVLLAVFTIILHGGIGCRLQRAAAEE